MYAKTNSYSHTRSCRENTFVCRMSVRGAFVFSLPYPVIRGNLPLFHSSYRPNEVERINKLADEWFAERWRMSEKIELWQTEFRGNAEAHFDAEHCAMELEDIYDNHIVPVVQKWEEIYRFVAGRSGGSLRCKNELTYEWFFPHQEAIYVVQTRVATASSSATAPTLRLINVQTRKKMHIDPSMVFELICLKYLQCACLQVLAFFKGVDNDIDEACRCSDLALAINAELVDSLLPCYAVSFGSNGSNTSFLASSHFHAEYILPHLQAQNDQMRAIKSMVTNSVIDTLYGATLLLRSCKLLQDASVSLYDSVSENYRRVILYSRCCAHFMMARAFWNAYVNDLALEIDETNACLFTNTSSAPDEPTPTIDNRWLAINAFYCIRSALAQLSAPQGVMQAMYEQIASTLTSNYSVMTPPAPQPGVTNSVTENDVVVIRCCLSDEVKFSQVTIAHPKTKFVDITQSKTYIVQMPPLSTENDPE